MQRPILLGASSVDALVPKLRQQQAAARVNKAARIAGYRGAIMTAHRPVERTRRRAAQGLVPKRSDIAGWLQLWDAAELGEEVARVCEQRS